MKELNVKRALIVNHNGVGNSIMTVPILMMLEKTFPGVKYYHTRSDFFEIPYFSNKAGLKGMVSLVDTTWRGFPRYKWNEIYGFTRKNKIDTVINLRNEGPEFDRNYFSFKRKFDHLINFIDLDFDTILNREHPGNLVEDMVTMLQKYSSKSYKYKPSWLSKWRDSDGSTKNVLLYVGASQLSKRWSTQEWVVLLKSIIRSHGDTDITVMAGATPQEAYDINRITMEILEERKANKISFVISRGLESIAEIFSKQSLIISNDTFAVHLGVAFGINTVGLYFCTDPDVWGYDTLNFIGFKSELKCDAVKINIGNCLHFDSLCPNMKQIKDNVRSIDVLRAISGFAKL